MTEQPLPARPAAPAASQHVEHHLDPQVNILGMWIFLSTEVMFFGAIFTAYMIYHWWYPEAFAEASRHLNVFLGGANTAILLTSSFTMALAVFAAQTDKRKLLTGFLAATLLFGLAFLGVKAVEYAAEFRENLFPGGDFQFPAPYTGQARLFFSFYFILTGLHLLHMLIGMGLISFLLLRNIFRRGRPVDPIPVEVIGLFWHFVDIVWIFIFPLLYLIKPHL